MENLQMGEITISNCDNTEDEEYGFDSPIRENFSISPDVILNNEKTADSSVPQQGDQTLAIFETVFNASQKTDPINRRLQVGLAIVLIVALCIQVVWALILIPVLIFESHGIPSNVLSLAALLITAILGEVVGMALIVVKFVFRTPIDVMIDLLKDIVKNK